MDKKNKLDTILVFPEYMRFDQGLDLSVFYNKYDLYDMIVRICSEYRKDVQFKHLKMLLDKNFAGKCFHLIYKPAKFNVTPDGYVDFNDCLEPHLIGLVDPACGTIITEDLINKKPTWKIVVRCSSYYTLETRKLLIYVMFPEDEPDGYEEIDQYYE